MIPNYTFEIAEEFGIPGLTISRRIRDGVQVGWRVSADEGFVFYDPLANDVETDPETLEKIPVTYYYTIAFLPKRYDFARFHYVAVPVCNVDPKYIS